MKHTTARPLLRLLVGCTFLVAGLAHAQYAWIDARGVHHYSDRPPPPDARPARMLKAPRAAGYSLEPPSDAPASATAAAALVPKATTTLAAREADFQKRQQDRAKAEQKAAEEAKRKSALAERCASLREYKAGLDSDMRVAITTASGEREFLSDDERARRLAKATAELKECR